jgi:NAD(P)-dependent dehydrogenase (short-subunit alcohol dehydrogenase family)
VGVLDRKAVAITGAGQGLGRAYAMSCAAAGARVLVNDIRADLADSVVSEILAVGGEAIADYSTVATWSGAASVVRETCSAFGSIDGLINNAGILRAKEAWLHDERDVRDTVEINLMGTMYCGIHALQQMRKQGHGSIVNITSGAQMGRALMSIYGATKAGIAGLTFGWAIEGKPHGIRANAMWPAASETALSQEYFRTAYAQQHGEAPAIAPENNAPLAVYLLSDMSVYLTGQVIALRGGRLAVITHPTWAAHVDHVGPWSIAAVESAFNDSLRSGLQELQFAEGQLGPY